MPLIDSAQWWEHLKKKVQPFFPLASFASFALVERLTECVSVCECVKCIGSLSSSFINLNEYACVARTTPFGVVDAEIDCRYNLIVCHARALRVHTEQKSHKWKSGQLSLNVESSRLAVARCEFRMQILIDTNALRQRWARALLAVRWRAPQTWKSNHVIYCIIMVASLISHANTIGSLWKSIKNFVCKMRINEFIRRTQFSMSNCFAPSLARIFSPFFLSPFFQCLFFPVLSRLTSKWNCVYSVLGRDIHLLMTAELKAPQTLARILSKFDAEAPTTATKSRNENQNSGGNQNSTQDTCHFCLHWDTVPCRNVRDWVANRNSSASCYIRFAFASHRSHDDWLSLGYTQTPQAFSPYRCPELPPPPPSSARPVDEGGWFCFVPMQRTYPTHISVRPKLPQPTYRPIRKFMRSRSPIKA